MLESSVLDEEREYRCNEHKIRQKKITPAKFGAGPRYGMNSTVHIEYTSRSYVYMSVYLSRILCMQNRS